MRENRTNRAFNTLQNELGWLIASMADELSERDFPGPYDINELHQFYLGLIKHHGVAAALDDAKARCELQVFGVLQPLRRLV